MPSDSSCALVLSDSAGATNAHWQCTGSKLRVDLQDETLEPLRGGCGSVMDGVEAVLEVGQANILLPMVIPPTESYRWSQLDC